MDAPDATRFILIGTSHPANVGAAARAMKVMGFSDLVLVLPRYADVLRRDEAIAMASGAVDVLASARVVATLPEAVDGLTFVAATAMTPRDFGPPTSAPRELFTSLAGGPHRVGFVFGSERFGLDNDAVYQCHACVSIPTQPGYGSLNLAQAVQLIAYEWRQALGGFPVVARTTDPELADAASLQGLLTHWEDALIRLDYLDPKVPRKLMSRLNQLANRVELTRDELQILRGVARAIEKALPRDGVAATRPPDIGAPGLPDAGKMPSR
ncbi:MAG: RNA methyltransferase [Caldimonas sp.]